MNEAWTSRSGAANLSHSQKSDCDGHYSPVRRKGAAGTAMTADTALRLGRFFNVSPSFWTNIQMRYELERAEDEAAPELARITPYDREPV